MNYKTLCWWDVKILKFICTLYSWDEQENTDYMQNFCTKSRELLKLMKELSGI